MENIFFDIRDVAKMLKLHPVTVRNKVRINKKGWFKIGTYWRINKSDFEKWIDGLKKDVMKKARKN